MQLCHLNKGVVAQNYKVETQNGGVSPQVGALPNRIIRKNFKIPQFGKNAIFSQIKIKTQYTLEHGKEQI